MGRQISATMTAILSTEPNLRLVERITLQQALQEQSLSLTGLVDTQQAVAVGKLIGAQILINGKVFLMGKKVYITAKLIGVETSLVEGALVRGDIDNPMDELVLQLTQNITQSLQTKASSLIPPSQALDFYENLKLQLRDRKLPTIAVAVRESHIPERRAAELDPAVETEIKKLLLGANVRIADVDANELTRWIKQSVTEANKPWPQLLSSADLIVSGEAFSEFAGRTGQLISCVARAEINVIDRKTGRVVLAESVTTRAVDLSENIAGKTALDRAGRQIAIALLHHLANTVDQIRIQE
ncbi:MAG: hypothetical protein HC898_12730 [Phycisphaerales bacterium]|nr:hypothetical protein [Phycisphaerales bacterium]